MDCALDDAVGRRRGSRRRYSMYAVNFIIFFGREQTIEFHFCEMNKFMNAQTIQIIS